jgi:hypothetical protein
MVVQLLGQESPLAKRESCKGLGKRGFGSLEEKLKPYGLLDELAWKIVAPDSRRALQDKIERRIHELNQRAAGSTAESL